MAHHLTTQPFRHLGYALLLVMTITWAADAEEPMAEPKPVPLTRPEMKSALEKLKQRQPRLPLPVPQATEEDQSGSRPVVNNGLARRLYLPSSWHGSDFGRDPAMTLDQTFKVRLFWLVSRGNNCHYCLGHQEIKLAMAGLSDDEIAVLDLDWSGFSQAEQAAMRFTQKLTLQPQNLARQDVMELKKYFDDKQLVELIYTISSYNSINRWTDSLGLPQDDHFGNRPLSLATPTSARFLDVQTRVVAPTDLARPDLESPDEVHKALAQCRGRTPVVELIGDEEARKLVGDGWPTDRLPQWVRAMAYFPVAGVTRIRSLRAVAEEGELTPQLKAQLAWIAARQNRAWYAVGTAWARLSELGMGEEEIFSLDGDWGSYPPAEQAAFALALKLTAAPKSIADRDIAQLRQHYADRQVAEIVYVVCAANMFDRFTEALELAHDPP